MNGLERESFKYSPVALLPTELTSPHITSHTVKSGESSNLITVIESGGFHNETLEISLAASASLHHWVIFEAPEDAVYLQQIVVNIGENSNYTLNAVTFASKWSRCDFHIRLNGKNAECHLFGLDLAKGHAHVDRHLLIEHVVGDTKSTQLFKGIFDEHATGSFYGKIKVHHGADGSAASQTNRNLLLSAHANVNTRPQLEIDTDEVQCTHGGTVGQLDDNAIFFMRSRGISEKDARAMLTNAFAQEVLGAFADQRDIAKRVSAWLRGGTR